MTWSRRWRRDRDGIVPAQALDRIRYRICKIAEDIIKLEEMLGYLLEALDVIEIPPEPPEQAGRSLYERLEISGMRSQLLRRTTDLKKNVGGASRYLEVLREMTGIVAEDRAYNLQRQLETHAKKNLELQENSKQTRIQLTLMLFVFSALMAWGFLDRLTGNSWTVMTRVLCFNVRSWPRVSGEHARSIASNDALRRRRRGAHRYPSAQVMNTEWANSLLNIIPTVPFAWFGVSLVLWVFFAGA